MPEADLRACIDALLRELRSLSPEESTISVADLAARHHLNESVVERLAIAEGHKIKAKPGGLVIDPEASTIDLDPGELQAAIESPDPDWKDEPTGIWRRNRDTGEWELASS
jgi:hypothetical protein